MLGYSRDELLGRSVEVLLPERFRNVHVGHRTKYYSDPALRQMGTGLDRGCQGDPSSQRQEAKNAAPEQAGKFDRGATQR